MFRRSFLAAAAGALALAPALAAGASPPPHPARHRLSSTYLTAIDAEALHGLTRGTQLELRADPARRFEPGSAVAVFAANRRLGYLPGTAGRIVAPLLASGVVPLGAEATRVRTGTQPRLDLYLFIAG